MFHDRFLILDGKELYHFGASLKNLGRQYYSVSKIHLAVAFHQRGVVNYTVERRFSSVKRIDGDLDARIKDL